MTLPSFLEYEDYGYIRLTGHRIGLAHLVREYNRGSSAEMLAVRFPSLRLSHIYQVLAIYLDNKADVDAYVAEDDAELKAQEEEYDRGKKGPSLVELKRRFNAMRASGS